MIIYNIIKWHIIINFSLYALFPSLSLKLPYHLYLRLLQYLQDSGKDSSPSNLSSSHCLSHLSKATVWPWPFTVYILKLKCLSMLYKTYPRLAYSWASSTLCWKKTNKRFISNSVARAEFSEEGTSSPLRTPQLARASCAPLHPLLTMTMALGDWVLTGCQASANLSTQRFILLSWNHHSTCKSVLC